MSVATATSLPTVTLRVPVGLVNDKTKDGWKLLEDTPLLGEPELELAEFLKPGESRIKGDVMFERAVALGNRAGQQHAERLLSQQDSIPKEWRDFYLVFPGTKWQRSDGDLVVPYLYWHDDRWRLDWYWLDDDFNDDDRLVRCK